MFDAIIIGAGVSGASLARELSKYRLSILVLEKDDDVCGGASRSNSATVHSGHDAKPGSKKARYNVLGNAMFDSLCAELSVPFKRTGMVVFAVSGEQMSLMKKLKAQADVNNVPGAAVLGRSELLEIEYFGPEVIGGPYTPSCGVVCPYSFTIALCENAAKNGVEFRLNAEVTEIVCNNESFTVKSEAGTFDCKYVFNCAGVNADIINNLVSAEKISILPRKGDHLILDRMFSGHVRVCISQPPAPLPGGGHTKGLGVVPSADGTIILGCDAVDVTDRGYAGCSGSSLEAIYGFFQENWRHLPLCRAFPELKREYVIGSFSGLRPHPSGDDFIIGETADVPRFFNAAGIESPGLTSAPAIAKDLAGMAAEKYGFLPNSSFNPARPHPKPFRDMTARERAEAIAEDPEYAKIVCRCEQVTLAEVKAAIAAPVGARSVNAVKMRTRAGMGRCQGGFCGPEVLFTLSGNLGIDPLKVTQCGGGSRILMKKIAEKEESPQCAK